MKTILALCFLAAAAVAAPNGYESSAPAPAAPYTGSSSYAHQPATSQAYSGPNQSYNSQPAAYVAPSISFSPPQISYSQPTITYSNPNHVPVAMPAHSSYGGGGSSSYGAGGGGSSYGQAPLVLGYQPSSGYSSSSYKK